MWQPGTAPGPAGWRDPFLAIPPGWDQHYLNTQTNRSHAMINHHERLVLDGNQTNSQDPQLTRGSGSNQFKFIRLSIGLPIYCPMLHKWVTQHCLGLQFECWMEFPNISLFREDVINSDCSKRRHPFLLIIISTMFKSRIVFFLSEAYVAEVGATRVKNCTLQFEV